MKYDIDWFHKRAWEVLRKHPDGYWDFSDSLLLYLPSAVKEYEEIQQDESPYAQLITIPEIEYLQSIVVDIVSHLPDEFNYIDLGPGTEKKEQFIFDAARKAGKQFTYIPVDVSEYYLQLATKNAESQNIPVTPIQCSFEELPYALSDVTGHKYILLGLTFGNYFPQDVFRILKDIAAGNGTAFIDPQIRDRVDMQRIAHLYAPDENMSFLEKVTLLGLDPATDIEGATYQYDEDIRVWCTVEKPTEKLAALGMKPGDKILLFQSLRYTIAQLEKELQAAGAEYTFLDTGSSFMGTLIQY